MAYSDFTIPELKKKFGLSVNEETDLFTNIAEAEIPATLADILRRYLPLSLNLNTEKSTVGADYCSGSDRVQTSVSG